MEEPNKSAMVLLQQEATELRALFDQLRGNASVPLDDQANTIAGAPPEFVEQTARVTL
ncbi:hypothetical protein [Xanthomonas sp. 3058]|uniref:hypothetical protein n=1 Tax=Xanthomonas sp. 3058 TaxID=3035314 RepID=UPI001611FA87|nr:hypothetical protein [Xanthomonas sp. 3058]MBB5862648.1 hypothetical protein [Xanthomonas sp. 3058]